MPIHLHIAYGCFHQWQSHVVIAEKLWPEKLKTFIIWPFTQNVCWLLYLDTSFLEKYLGFKVFKREEISHFLDQKR